MLTIRCQGFQYTYNISIITYAQEKIIISYMTCDRTIFTLFEYIPMCNDPRATMYMVLISFIRVRIFLSGVTMYFSCAIITWFTKNSAIAINISAWCKKMLDIRMKSDTILYLFQKIWIQKIILMQDYDEL